MVTPARHLLAAAGVVVLCAVVVPVLVLLDLLAGNLREGVADE